jgi:hypothetical protein
VGHGADTHDKCLQKKNRTILDPGADAQTGIFLEAR